MRFIIFLLLIISIPSYIFAQDTLIDRDNTYFLKYSGSINLAYDYGIYSFYLPGFGVDREKFEIVNGVKLNSYMSIGIGSGMHYYFDFDKKDVWLPIFVNMKITFMKNKISPFISLSSGYSFDLKNKFNNIGFLVNSFLGIKYRMWNKFSLATGMGFEMQKVKVFLWDKPAYLNAMTFNISLWFN